MELVGPVQTITVVAGVVVATFAISIHPIDNSSPCSTRHHHCRHYRTIRRCMVLIQQCSTIRTTIRFRTVGFRFHTSSISRSIRTLFHR
uniref:Putative secreted protein n=1 Tax=Anopheles darlingi TaxID=43151 RepID=A0A2M4DD06_ANODA